MASRVHANDTLAHATAALKKSVGGEPLCARSLAALLAASPSTTTAGVGATVSDSASDGSSIGEAFGSLSALPSKKALAPTKVVARGSHDESSTDTGDAPVLYESSTDESEYESDHINP